MSLKGNCLFRIRGVRVLLGKNKVSSTCVRPKVSEFYMEKKVLIAINTGSPMEGGHRITAITRVI